MLKSYVIYEFYFIYTYNQLKLKERLKIAIINTSTHA